MKRLILVLLLLPMLSGCARMLAFGTATKFGLDISQRPDQMMEVTFGYDRAEVASIPAREQDATRAQGGSPCPGQSQAATSQMTSGQQTSNTDTYSVLGIFSVSYGNPWKDEPLTIRQFFATGWAARNAACDPRFQQFFGNKTGEIIMKRKEPGQ